MRNSTIKVKTEKNCSQCPNIFRPFSSLQKTCSPECARKEHPFQKKARTPITRGTYVIKRGPRTIKHLSACSKYKKAFMEKHGRIFCEACGADQSIVFQTHHLYFASRYPSHQELHNPKNLIIACHKCHDGFHGTKGKEMLAPWEERRNLKELFSKKPYVQATTKAQQV